MLTENGPRGRPAVVLEARPSLDAAKSPSLSSKTAAVDDAWAHLLVLCSGNPHLLKR